MQNEHNCVKDVSWDYGVILSEKGAHFLFVVYAMVVAMRLHSNHDDVMLNDAQIPMKHETELFLPLYIRAHGVTYACGGKVSLLKKHQYGHCANVIFIQDDRTFLTALLIVPSYYEKHQAVLNKFVKD